MNVAEAAEHGMLVADAAKRLRVSRERVHALIKDRRIRVLLHERTGGRGRLWVAKVDVDREAGLRGLPAGGPSSDSGERQ